MNWLQISATTIPPRSSFYISLPLLAHTLRPLYFSAPPPPLNPPPPFNPPQPPSFFSFPGDLRDLSQIERDGKFEEELYTLPREKAGCTDGIKKENFFNANKIFKYLNEQV
jgi:hypothetical protein